MFQLSESTRVGLTYRSKIREDIRGQATFNNPSLPGPAAGLTQTPLTTDGGARTTIWLPESATLNVFNQTTGNLSLMANAVWTRWSQLNQLNINFDNGAPASTINFYWRNTWTFAGAANYRLNETIKLRIGYEFEQGAARNGYYNPIIPEANRRLLGLGFNLRLSDKGSMDFAYAKVSFSNFGFSNTVPGQGTVSGNYRVGADIFAIQYNRAF